MFRLKPTKIGWAKWVHNVAKLWWLWENALSCEINTSVHALIAAAEIKIKIYVEAANAIYAGKRERRGERNKDWDDSDDTDNDIKMHGNAKDNDSNNNTNTNNYNNNNKMTSMLCKKYKRNNHF